MFKFILLGAMKRVNPEKRPKSKTGLRTKQKQPVLNWYAPGIEQWHIDKGITSE